MLYDSKLKQFKGKFSTGWLGPYEVDEVFDNGSLRIKTIDGSQTSFVLNGHRLKIYHQPLSKQQFLQEVRRDPETKLVHENDQPLVGSSG